MRPLGLDPAVVEYLSLGTAALALVALLLALVALARARRLRRAWAAVEVGPGESLVHAVERHAAEVARLRAEVGQVGTDLAAARAALAASLRHVGAVRYDAFGDVGGHMSFSLALLDDSGDGLVVTSIAGRHESRTYAKVLRDGQPDAQLSPEEGQALAAARGAAAAAAPGAAA